MIVNESKISIFAINSKVMVNNISTNLTVERNTVLRVCVCLLPIFETIKRIIKRNIKSEAKLNVKFN